MPYHQAPPGLSGRPQSFPDSNSEGESVIAGSENLRLKPFRSGDQPRRNYILLARGFSMTFFSLVLLVICLREFSQLQALSKWEQRTFNTLSILLTAIASLGLGSLLRHLGSMLRWPLIARMVDSILGIAPPAGTLRMIKRHIRERRISRTTLIVTTYLVTNVVGRLSVAIFGLAYNMTDKTGIENPILVTNGTSALWTDRILFNKTSNTRVDQNLRHGKDTTPQTLCWANEQGLTSLIRVLEFGMEWIVEVRQVPCLGQCTLGAATIEFHRGYPVLRGQLGVNPGTLESKECNSPDLSVISINVEIVSGR
ncbi:hypothetical protein HOY80DRAFT_1094809 [Tuber brumale]|nr:hypothetical protein HOY80DRAFT_1094809 [Tuber brumale]